MPVVSAKGLVPLFGSGLYEVETKGGEGMLWFSEDDAEWFNVELDGEFQALEGDVTFIRRKVHEANIESAVMTEAH